MSSESATEPKFRSRSGGQRRSVQSLEQVPADEQANESNGASADKLPRPQQIQQVVHCGKSGGDGQHESLTTRGHWGQQSPGDSTA
jgi:hypothetical protein